MKRTTLTLVILVFLSIIVRSQIIHCGDANIANIFKKLKVDANDRYAVNEAFKIKLEANKWLNSTKQLNSDLEKLNQIAEMASKFEEIKVKTQKSIESTQSEIMDKKLDAIESFELSNDIIFAFFKNQKSQLKSKINKEFTVNFDNLIKETDTQWNKAKELRKKGYAATEEKAGLEILVSAQKQEDEVIARIEKAVSTYFSFEYLPNNLINYNLFLDGNPENKNVAKLNEENQKDNIVLTEVKPLIVDNIPSATINETINNNVAIETPHKIFYRIQVGAFLKRADESVFRGINPVITEKNQNGFTRYLAGEYNSSDVAVQALKVLKETGFSDAFLVTYDNGIRLIPENKNIDIKNLAGK